MAKTFTAPFAQTYKTGTAVVTAVLNSCGDALLKHAGDPGTAGRISHSDRGRLRTIDPELPARSGRS